MLNLVYLSPVPLLSFAQRPHKFVEWFRKTEGKVLWVDPYPTRLPRLSDLTRTRDKPVSTTASLPPGIMFQEPRALPIEPLPLSGKINQFFWGDLRKHVAALKQEGPLALVVGKPSHMALMLLDEGGFVTTAYDAMDDFPAFYDGFSQRSMAARESAVVDRVVHMMVSSTRLADRWGSKRDVKFVPNACDIEKLPAVSSLQLSAKEKPILGYVGTMGQWFDWSLLVAIAQAKPELSVHLVGPVFTPPPGELPANVHIFPPCAHEKALEVMQTFTIGLIPFKKNRLTEAVDPIKYYEYRALGLPVLTSAFGEMLEHEKDHAVFCIDSTDHPDHLLKQIDAAISHRIDIDDVARFRHANSWQQRFNSSCLF